MTNPIRDACTALGGISATARTMNTSRAIVHRWIRAGCVPTSATCLRLAALSGVPAWRLAGMDADPAG